MIKRMHDDILVLAERSYAATPGLHNHNFYQVLVAGRGQLEMRVEGVRCTVEEGHWAVVPAGAEHLYWAEGPNGFLVADLAAPLVVEARARLRRPGALSSYICMPADERLAPLAALLRAELRAGGLAERPVAEALAGYLSAALVQALGPSSAEGAPDARAGVVRRAQEYIEAGLTSELSLADIAAAAGASISHLQRSFRAHTGQTVIEYIHALRLQRACTLLQSSPLPIHAVAAAVGFASPAYFSRLFTRSIGCSPARYRAESDKRLL